LRWFWPGLAPSEGSRQLQAARERARDAQLSPALRARLALADATISLVFGDYAHSLAAAEAALTLARSLGDEFEIAVALRACAQAMRLLGRVAESMEFLEDAAARFRRLGATRFLALTLDVLAAHHRAEGDLSLARFELEEAIAAARVTGFERGLQMFEVNLAELEFASGNVMRAIELAEAAVTRSYAVYVPRVFGIARANLAGYYAALGRWDAARQCALQAIVLGREAQRPQTVARAIEIIAAAAAEEGRPELAARLCGFADASLAALGSERDPAEAARREQLLATLERYFDGPKFAALRASGSALTEEAALELTGAVPQRASVA